MSDAKSRANRPSVPRDALDALLAEPAGDPLRRALWLDALDRRLRLCLPSSLAAHLRLANFTHGKLVFVVDSPIWRTKVRLAAPELLVAARSIGLDAAEVVVKATTTPLAPPVRVERTAIPMSAAASDALQAALASLKDADPGKADREN